MDPDIKRKIDACAHADNAEWEEVVAAMKNVTNEQKAFLREHSPGLVRALWLHFDATRDRCGCATPAHERPECPVSLVERLLLDGEIS